MFEARPLPERTPRDVPGYAQAARNGVVCPVPRHPPRLLPGPTAHHEFRRFLARSVAVVAVTLVAVEVLARSDGGLLRSGAMLLVGLGCMAVVFRFWNRVGERNVEEFAAGYTTFRMAFGGWWLGEGRRWQGVGRRAPWDYSGIWVLDPGTGSVVAIPDLSVDPPGFYPSPNRPGRLELWSGQVWTGRYRVTG